MSRSTPPAQPVIMPATITIGSEAFICQATSQPSMHTPAQSMLRRPAASAAVIACAVNATYDKRCRTVSPGGKLHMATSHREPRGIAGSNITGLQLWRGTSAHANHCLAAYRGMLTEEPIHGIPTQS